ncbi:MAG TPA: DnaB-like helicase C-terminal domain-containing protein, partial [Gemmatimonadaceae bacterium]
QFNRATSANNEHPPTPEGLMGGSPIENDSDQVILLDHSQYERINDHGNVYALAPLILAKNRHGSMTEIPIKMDFRCLRITEVQVAGSGLDADGPTPMAYELRRDEPHPADCEPEYGEVYEPADVAPGALDFFAGRS